MSVIQEIEILHVWCEVPDPGIVLLNGPHPNPSPDAREKGCFPRRVPLGSAPLRRMSPAAPPAVPPLPRIGRGAGGEGGSAVRNLRPEERQRARWVTHD